MSIARRGLTALAGLAVVAGTLVGIAAPASASISSASISPATWAPSEQAAATVSWNESAASSSNGLYTSGGNYLSVEVGWGWAFASANPTNTPVQYAAVWNAGANSYTCATIGVVFASPGFTNNGGDIRCYVQRSSGYVGNPGQQVVLSSIDSSHYFGVTAGSTITVSFAAGSVTAPSAGPASDTWRIISLATSASPSAGQTTTVTTLVPGTDAAGNTVSLITLDFDANGGTCATSKLTGVSGSWGVAPDAQDCTRPGYTFTGWNTSANGSGTWILPKGNINFTGDNRVYSQWMSPTSAINPPDAPTNVIATAGWNKVQVNWTAPVNEGSLPITNYLVTSFPGNKICISNATMDRKPTQCTLSNLTPGVKYTFTAQALNGAGWSDRSVVSNEAAPYTLRVVKFARSKVLFGLAGSKIKLDVLTRGFAPGVTITPMVSYDKGAHWSAFKGDAFRTSAGNLATVSLKIGRNQNNTTVSVKFKDERGLQSNIVDVAPAK